MIKSWLFYMKDDCVFCLCHFKLLLVWKGVGISQKKGDVVNFCAPVRFWQHLNYNLLEVNGTPMIPHYLHLLFCSDWVAELTYYTFKVNAYKLQLSLIWCQCGISLCTLKSTWNRRRVAPGNGTELDILLIWFNLKKNNNNIFNNSRRRRRRGENVKPAELISLTLLLHTVSACCWIIYLQHLSWPSSGLLQF